MEIIDYIITHGVDATYAKCTIEINKIGSVKKDGENEKLGEAYMDRGYARCFVLSKNKDYEKAIEDLSMALVLITDDEPHSTADKSNSTDDKPHNELKAECYVKRAYAYWLNGNYERAKKDCEQSVINDNGKKNVKAAADELLGSIYLEYEDPEEAIKHYEEALLVNPLSFSLLEYYREANKRLNNT